MGALDYKLEAPDRSVRVAAEAEYLLDEINEAILRLQLAKVAAENERNRDAKAHMNGARFSLECALMPVKED